MASYNLFLELAKVIGATRMMELCELYIARNRQAQPTQTSAPVVDSLAYDQALSGTLGAADNSGARFWYDCSGDAIYPPTWLLGAKVSAPGLPAAPKKQKQAFQSPLLSSTPLPEETDTPKRRLSFSSLDSMPPLESYGK